jgi:hypothetical protein
MSNHRLKNFQNAMKYYELTEFWQNRYQCVYNKNAVYGDSEKLVLFKDTWGCRQQLHSHFR